MALSPSISVIKRSPDMSNISSRSVLMSQQFQDINQMSQMEALYLDSLFQLTNGITQFKIHFIYNFNNLYLV